MLERAYIFILQGPYIKHPQGLGEARNPPFGVIYLRFCGHLIQKNFKINQSVGLIPTLHQPLSPRTNIF